ncbi:toxin VasX [Photobacterium damselae]|uniref:toxin VasX n=1 Tax=Photobacterium damselae TaxID=38293 RepID=UPI0025434A86
MTNALSISCQKDSSEIDACMSTCPMQAEDIDIVPIRYAIDALDNEGKVMNGLPDSWLYNGVFSGQLYDKQYTARQLRDGWLYVYCTKSKKFHEYQVLGQAFVQKDIESWCQSKGVQDRGETTSSSFFISYPSTEFLYIGYSRYRWSWSLVSNLLNSKVTRKIWMRELDLSSIRYELEAPHSGLIDELGSIAADIDNPNANFVNHCVRTQDSDEPHEHVNVKEAVLSSSITSLMEDAQSACFVMLDDTLSDITDLYLQLCKVYAERTEYLANDDLERKLTIASIAKMSSQVVMDDIKNAPQSVLNDPIQSLEFEQVLNDYLGEVYTQNRVAPMYDYVNPKVAETKQRLLDKFGYTPDKELLQNYQERFRYRDEIRWVELNAFYDQHVHNLEIMTTKIERAYNNLMSSLLFLGTDISRLGVDLSVKEQLTSILPLFTEIAELVIQAAPNEESKKLLEQAISSQSSESLLALVPYGLSAELKAELDKTVLENPLLTGVGDVGALAGRMAELETLFGYDGLTNSSWYGGLSIGLKTFINDFIDVVHGCLDGIFERLLTAIFPIMAPTKDISRSAYNLQGIVLTSLFSREAVVVNKSYQNQLRNYKYQYNDALTKVQRLKRLKSGTIVSPDYLRQLRRAENNLAIVMAEYPELLTLKNQTLNNEIRMSIRTYVHKALKMGKAIVSSGYNVVQGLGGIVAFLNVWNFSAQWEGNEFYHADGSIDKKSLRVVGSAGAWTGNAIADVYRGRLWNVVAKKQLLGLSINVLSETSFSLAFKIGASSLAMGIFGIIASTTEGYQTYLDLQEMRESEVGPMWMKLIALGGQSVTFLYITVATFSSIIFSVQIASIFTALASFSLVILGLLYLVGTLLGNHIKKNALEEWLVKSIWGKEYEGISAKEEYENYQALMAKPTITLSLPIYNMPEYGQIKIEVPESYIDSEVYLKIEHIKKVKQGYPLGSYKNETSVISDSDLNCGVWKISKHNLYYILNLTLSSDKDEVRVYFVNSEKNMYTNKTSVGCRNILNKKSEVDIYLSDEYVFMPLSAELLKG